MTTSVARVYRLVAWQCLSIIGISPTIHKTDLNLMKRPRGDSLMLSYGMLLHAGRKGCRASYGTLVIKTAGLSGLTPDGKIEV